MASDALRATPEQAERLHTYAHDLRNRLASMQQALRILSSPEPDLDPAELGNFTEQQFFKAMRQLEELLDDLEVDRSIGTLTKSSVEIGKHLGTALESLEHRTERKQQRVEVVQPQTLHAKAHPDTLERLLSALLSNASKFSEAGATIRVEVTVEADRVLIHVIDHGVGLEPSDLEHLFERYAWLSSRSTAGEEQGRSTLAKARQLARAMGGELTAGSDGPGKGTRFTLTLEKA
jgi:signal transduction histidine kinase